MSKNSQVPSIGEPAFTCPYCHVFSQQHWVSPNLKLIDEDYPYNRIIPERVAFNEKYLNDLSQKILLDNFRSDIPNETIRILGLIISFCSSCSQGALWQADKLIYPISGLLPTPHSDMPENVLENYEEASKVAPYSINAAAALLRLALQNLLLKICNDSNIANVNHRTNLGKLIEIIEEKAENGKLLAKAMHKIRKAGNDALHPSHSNSETVGEIIPAEKEEIYLLADCLNLITEQLALIKRIEA